MTLMTKTGLIEQLFVRFHMAPHESAPPSPQSSMEEGGESTPEEGGEEHQKPEGAEGEQPLSLVDLLGLAKF
jgi:ryanodine receptor 2